LSAERELVTFPGAVRCVRADGAVNLVLSGGGAELLFEGATPVPLPAQLRAARVLELTDSSGSEAAAGTRQFRIEAASLSLELRARGVQLHRDATTDLLRALPPPRVPRRVRLGWWLVLWLLRIPGSASLVRLARGVR
jgi:hypothetical protein